MTRYMSTLPVAVFTLALTACGGSSSSGSSDSVKAIDYSGAETQALLSTDNQDDFAASAAEILSDRLQRGSTPDVSLPIGVVAESVDADRVAEQAKNTLTFVEEKLAGYGLNIPVAASSSEVINGDCGGTLKASGNETSGSIVLSNFCNYDGANTIILNGKMSFAYKETATEEIVTLEMSNYSVTADGETLTMSGTAVMTNNKFNDDNSFYISVRASFGGETVLVAGREVCVSGVCTDSDYVEAGNGQVYRIDNTVVTSNINSYDVNAVFFHPSHGSVELSGDDLTLCNDGSIGSGVMYLSDADQTLTVTFSACGEYSVELMSNNLL